MTTTRLYLVRHGEAAHPAGGEYAQAGLSETGRAQAERLGARLAGVGRAGGGFDVVRHSPLRRAVETAALLAAHLPGVPVESSELLRDRTPILTGPPAEQVPQRYQPFLDAVPDDERDVGAVRLREAVATLVRAGAGDRTELLVSHAFVIGWFVRHVLDAPEWRWIGLNPSCCGLTVIEAVTGREPRLLRFDDVGHLGAG